MWVFGYASLIWKVDFPYAEKLVGHLKGYSRKFWQASEDHRGVPGKPGRVATLVPSNGAVWGVAYRIPAERADDVQKHLAFREKGGYEEKHVTFYPREKDVAPFTLQIFIGTSTNPFYLGPADHTDIARQISLAEGPSGKNSEYLFELAEAMRKYIPEENDDDLYALERLVRQFISEQQTNAIRE